MLQRLVQDVRDRLLLALRLAPAARRRGRWRLQPGVRGARLLLLARQPPPGAGGAQARGGGGAQEEQVDDEEAHRHPQAVAVPAGVPHAAARRDAGCAGREGLSMGANKPASWGTRPECLPAPVCSRHQPSKAKQLLE